MNIKNWRFNPFTGVTNSLLIEDETHTIEYKDDWNGYGIQLDEAPELDVPSSVEITENITGGAEFDEVPRTQSPSSGEFRVDYDADTYYGTGRIEFNPADNGTEVLVTYYGNGSVVKAGYQGNITFDSDVAITGKIEVDEIETDKVKTDIISEKTADNGVDIGSILKFSGSYNIFSQAQFNSIIDRVAANQYKINDSITFLILHNLSGGYQMLGALSGGDSWGYVEANNCKSIEFKGGAFLDFENERGYIEVDTDDCYLKNVDIRGTGTVASAITQSYLLNAHRITFDNCKTSQRLSNVDFACFQGSGTALHNTTSKYINCMVYTINGSDKIYGFKDCINLNGCIAYDIDGNGDHVYGFSCCNQISGCLAEKIDYSGAGASSVVGFDSCYNLAGCKTLDLDRTGLAGGSCAAFNSCSILSGCHAYDINGNTGGAIGFSSCNLVLGCMAENIDSNKNAGNVAIGFNGCNIVSGCMANNIEAINAGGGNAVGFVSCVPISACKVLNINSTAGTAEGFKNCQYGAALYTNEAVNAGNDWIDTVDAQITNKVSTPSIWT